MRGLHASRATSPSAGTESAPITSLPRGRLRLRRQLPPEGRQSAGRPRCRAGQCDAGARGSAGRQRRSAGRDDRDPPAPLRSLADVRITVLGLAFKPDTDDVRESPAVPIVERLLAAGSVVAHPRSGRELLPEQLAETDVELTRTSRTRWPGRTRQSSSPAGISTRRCRAPRTSRPAAAARGRTADRRPGQRRQIRGDRPSGETATEPRRPSRVP